MARDREDKRRPKRKRNPISNARWAEISYLCVDAFAYERASIDGTGKPRLLVKVPDLDYFYWTTRRAAAEILHDNFEVTEDEADEIAKQIAAKLGILGSGGRTQAIASRRGRGYGIPVDINNITAPFAHLDKRGQFW